MIKMLQYKMYPAGELRCPTTALVIPCHMIVSGYYGFTLAVRHAFIFMPSASKKLEGHIASGMFVCPSIRHTN